jgi:hypothetical protein
VEYFAKIIRLRILGDPKSSVVSTEKLWRTSATGDVEWLWRRLISVLLQNTVRWQQLPVGSLIELRYKYREMAIGSRLWSKINRIGDYANLRVLISWLRVWNDVIQSILQGGLPWKFTGVSLHRRAVRHPSVVNAERMQSIRTVNTMICMSSFEQCVRWRSRHFRIGHWPSNGD